MFELRRTVEFAKWEKKLNNQARARIYARLERLEHGHIGDSKCVARGVNELRIFHGPGYRIYFAQYDKIIILLLIGGDKKTQKVDIQKAKKLAEQYYD